MKRLVAVDLPGGESFVLALKRAWDSGDAVIPLDARLPPPGRDALLTAVAPSALISEDGVTSLGGGRPVADGDALVVATSGTTGFPKAAVLTHEAVAAAARATSLRLEVDPSTDRWLACLPLAHVGGLSVVSRAIVTGTPLTVIPGFDAEAVSIEADRGATLVSLVATALARIDPDRFRRILVGGGPPLGDLPSNAVATYGMTETGGGVVYDGTALDGVEFDIAESGEILLSTPTLARCYRHSGGQETPLQVRDGWFSTGDIGARDAGGRLTVLGRSDEMIVTGGEKIWPADVESVIALHPDVAEVAVTGVADPEWGQAVVAYVVPARSGEPPTLDSLRSLVRESLPPWSAPRTLELVDSLPRTSLGKVRRAALRPTTFPPTA